jgi:serine/threonine protein kinase
LTVALPNERVLPPPTQQGRLARQAGAEPIPGYRLIEPLGSGGFGEVWKCVAPGGLMKAVKFVGGEANAGGSLASQEFEAIERIKSIRHPFLLSLERVEVVDGVLVLVMELADRNLQNVLLDYQRQGLPGIPRRQLLGFLEEAAEALDVINFEHGLQHLDVKPHNLFVVSNHVKVADFGLVHRLPELGADPSAMRRGGATPLYASPETLQGSLSRNSDQYSLAIVYQQLLTGTVPYWSANPYQLLLQHVSGKPDLSAVPPMDQPLMARALAKSPERRFASCMDFVRALVEVSDSASGVRPNLRSVQAENVISGLREENRFPISPGDQSDQRTVPGIVAADLARLTPVDIRSPSAVAVAAADPLHLPQPSGISLPGYRLLTCVGRTPTGVPLDRRRPGRPGASGSLFAQRKRIHDGNPDSIADPASPRIARARSVLDAAGMPGPHFRPGPTNAPRPVRPMSRERPAGRAASGAVKLPRRRRQSSRRPV